MPAPLRRSTLTLCSVLLAAAGASAQTLPVADAGDDQILDCAPPAGALVALDGSESLDPDGAVLAYTWTGDALPLPVDGATPSVLLPPGVHVLTLTVDDGVDGSASDEVTVTVIADETPPELVLAVESDELWPPNHKLHRYAAVDLVESASDDCSDLTVDDVVFGRGTSDEPDEAIGDGNFSDDIAFFESCSEAELRAERAGPERDGRVYELFLRVADGAGNVTEAPFVVSVPHDRAHAAVDSGDDHEVECEGVSCAPTPDPACTEADASEVAIADGAKGPALRWSASGFAAGAVSADGAALCLYVNGAAAGGSLDPDKVRVKAKKGQGALGVATRGSDLDVPALPLPDGALLRLELHDGAGDCVSASFDEPSVNEAGAYQATSH